MNRIFSIVLIGFVFTTVLQAQNHKHGEDPSLHLAKPVEVHNLREFMGEGRAHGFVRYNFMSTWHPKFDHHYFANAIGGNLGYYTPSYKGVSFGVSGVFVHNLYGSEVGHGHDERWAGRLTPFELELFDLQHPDETNDLDRLEELFVRYQYKDFFIKIGKMDVETPLINKQDTRMKPYVIRGVWAETMLKQNTRIAAAWFDKASPRSTTHWFSMKDAVGIYWQGYDVNGDTAAYNGQLNTSGIGLFGFESTLAGTEVRLWNYWFHNVSNTTFFQAEKSFDMTSKSALQVGVQWAHQEALNHGGNEVVAHSYHVEGEKSNVVSGRVKVKRSRWSYSGNYTWFSDEGRFLFPQELGREQFYTFMPRARHEGMGNVHAASLKTCWHPKFDRHMTATFMLGRNWLPDWNDYALNKYERQSYDHFAVDFKYEFEGFFKGLTVDLFYIYQDTQWMNDPVPEKEEVNFQFHHLNVVANISF